MNKFNIDFISKEELEVEPIFDDCTNTNFSFLFGATSIYTHEYNPNKKMLKCKSMTYCDELYQKFYETLTFYNQDKEILNESTYNTYNDLGDKKYKHIEVACFDDFFGLIINTDIKANGTSQHLSELFCYSYDGQLIIKLEPPKKQGFDYFNHEDVENLINIVKTKQSEQENNEQ